MKRFAYARTATQSVRPVAAPPSKAVIVIPKVKTSARSGSTIKIEIPRNSSFDQFSTIQEDDKFESDDDKRELIKLGMQHLSKQIEITAPVKTSRSSKSLENKDVISGSEKSKFAQEFINNYTLSNYQDHYAYVIQSAFRLYRNKMHWRNFIKLRTKYHRRITELFFHNWRISVVNDPTIIKKEFKKLKNACNQLTFVPHGREFAAFPYFYISNQIYTPKGFNSQFLYQFVHIAYTPMKFNYFTEWQEAARKLRQERLKFAFISFSVKKNRVFGNVLTIFQNWYRFTKWKRLMQSQQPAKSKDSKHYITLNSTEVNVHWNVQEHKLNQFEKRKARAINYSKKQILSRAVKALYNQSVKRTTDQALAANSDIFRNLQLMKLAYSAWSRYMEINQHKRQMQHDILHNWYDYAYKKAKLKQTVTFYQQREKRFFLLKILNRWNKVKEIQKIKNLEEMMRIQKNSTLALQFIFILLKQGEISYQLRCWQLWIRFTRQRHKWHQFSGWSDKRKITEDLNRETICELKRISNNKMLGRIQEPETEIIPRKTCINLESTLEEVHRIDKEIQFHVNVTKHGSTQSMLDFSAVKIPCKSYVSLMRAFILFLHSKQKFDIYGTIQDQNWQPSGTETTTTAVTQNEMNLTIEEFTERVWSNAKIFKQNLQAKLARDKPIVSLIRAHIEACKLKQVLPDFRTCKDGVKLKESPENPVSEENLVILLNFEKVSQRFIDSLLKKPNRIQTNLMEEYNAANKTFSRRLRQPDVLLADLTRMKSQISFNIVSDMAAQRNHDASKIKNARIESFNKESNNEIDLSTKNSMIQLSGLFGRQASMALFDSSSKFGISSSSSAFDNFGGNGDTMFTALYLRSKIGEYTTVSELISAVSKFFSTFAQTPLHIGGNIIQYNSKTMFDGVKLESLKKRVVNKNINSFIQTLSQKEWGTMAKEEVLLEFAKNCVTAIITCNRNLKETKLAEYCVEFPFIDLKDIDNESSVLSRDRLWRSIKKRFPKMDTSTSGMSLRQLSSHNSVNRLETVDQNLSVKDAYICCLTVPFILEEDALADFMRAKMMETQNGEVVTTW